MEPKNVNSELYQYLENVNSPEDLKALPAEKLPALAEEIRAFLVKHVLKNGGHPRFEMFGIRLY